MVLEGMTSALPQTVCRRIGIYDFENEFQFQLQGYPRPAKRVNPPPYNRLGLDSHGAFLALKCSCWQ